MISNPHIVRSFDDTVPESTGITFGWPPGFKSLRMTVVLSARLKTPAEAPTEARFLLRIGTFQPINVRDPAAARTILWLASDPEAAVVLLADDVLDPLHFPAGPNTFHRFTLGPYDVESTGSPPEQLLATRVPYGQADSGDVEVLGLDVTLEA